MRSDIGKCTFRHVHPVKIQISLCIHAVQSESSLKAFWIAKNAKFLHASIKDCSDCMDVQADLRIQVCFLTLQPIVFSYFPILGNIWAATFKNIYADSQGSDQPARLCILIRAVTVQ